MTDSPEFLVTLIECLMEEGQDVRDAILEIGEERVQASMIAGDGLATPAQHRLLDFLSIKLRMDADEEDMGQALELTSAGWMSEDPRAVHSPHLPPPATIWEKTAVASWKWRAPSRRPGKPGRLYHSTNQAWRAMKRAAGELA